MARPVMAGGKAKPERGPGAQGALHADLTAQPSDNSLYNGQPEPMAARPRRSQSGKLEKESILVLVAQPAPIVAYPESHDAVVQDAPELYLRR